MQTKIVCLHTADIHCVTFARLFDAATKSVALTHVVRPEWLDEARRHGVTPTLHATVAAFLGVQAQTFDAVLCTCSTLGPIAATAAMNHSNIVRIDSALMRQAATHGGGILVAACLESTLPATMALLHAALAVSGRGGHPTTVLCSDAWPYFERGEVSAFAAAIARHVRVATATLPDLSCVVLTQASMAAAGDLLDDLGVPIYGSPSLAVEETLRVALRSTNNPVE